jgi:hypothetical protein
LEDTILEKIGEYFDVDGITLKDKVANDAEIGRINIKKI